MRPAKKVPWFIGQAIEATEIGYRVISDKMNDVLDSKNLRPRIEAGSKRADDSLSKAVESWKQALAGLQTLKPFPTPYYIFPWSIGFLGQHRQREAYFSLDGLNVYDADPNIVPCLASGIAMGVFESLLDAICRDLKTTTKKWSVKDWEERIIGPIQNHHSSVIARLSNFQTADGDSFTSVPDSAIVSLSGAVKIFSNGAAPIVDGKVKKKLTRPRFVVLKALIEAGELGLSKDQLDDLTDKTDARKILSGLCKDPDWKKVIVMAGKAHGRYHLV